MFKFPKSILQPGDEVCEGYYPELSENYYHHYFDQIKKFNVKSVVEIGVRAGYSAYAMLSANPTMKYVGYDIDSDNEYGFHSGAFQFASAMLKSEFPKADLQFFVQDSQKLTKIPGNFDLAHVDGDHSFGGCTHDLWICSKAAKILLVDDYDFVPEVRDAVDRFVEAHRFKHEYIKNFRGMMVVHT